MSIKYPFEEGSSSSPWDVLILDGAMLPGLVTSAIPTINIEIDSVAVNQQSQDVPGGAGIISSFNSSSPKFVNQYYTQPSSQKPKEMSFTLLIYTPEDFAQFTQVAKFMTKGKSWKISHPQCTLWEISKVYITNITTSHPSADVGWEISFSCIEAIDKPKILTTTGVEGYIFHAKATETVGNVRELKPKNPNGKPATSDQQL